MFSLSALARSGLFISGSNECRERDRDTVPAVGLKLARMIQGFKARGGSRLKSGEERSADSALRHLNIIVNLN